MTGFSYSNNGNRRDTESGEHVNHHHAGNNQSQPQRDRQSRRCSNTAEPMTAISTIPTPDQMAYAMPIGMCFSTKLRQQKAAAYPATVTTEGQNFVNRPLCFRKEVATVSKTMAVNNTK